MADVGTLTVIRDVVNTREFAGPGGSRMYLYSESGRLALAIDIAPREIEYGGLAHDWASADRSGRTPLLLHSATPLRTMGFSFMITDKVDFTTPQASKIAILRDVARTFERVLVRFSGAEQGLWRITELSLSSQLRSPDNDEITRATVSVTLTEASDPAPAVGPVSKPPPPPPNPPSGGGRTWTVVKGDTLWGLAKRFYDNGARWPQIFDANRTKIKDPHWIYPGQVFTIP
jgi:nucleoid-associated protein YgaU